jgi:hypothetical protein
VYIFLALNFLMTPPQNAIRLLPGDRLLAFSEDHLLVYSFVTAGEAGVAPPVVALDATEPLWKLSFTGTQIDCGGLSQGLLNETATYFVVHARNLYALIVPHDEHQTPHFYPLVEFDSSKNPMCAIGFEKAFIQHMDRSITRLNFACEKGEASDTGSLPDSVVFRDYPTTHNGARIPKLDEETGRIVQDLRFGFRVVDTALIYMEGVEVEENLLS